ncbi:MAG: bifunctional [glutamate--ammonia ligase]-adenylyl-L-tyrosine phosphorylase/[glutamate--ammonia-ligase] adenylyltransferase [Fimbriiglobus sp.]
MPLDPATFAHWGLTDVARAERNLASIQNHTPDDFSKLFETLDRTLPGSPDPDLILNNLERLIAVPAFRSKWASFWQPTGRGIDGLLQLLAVSQFFADTLVMYPEAIEMVRTAPLISPSTGELIARLRSEVEASFDDASILRAIRKFRHLQMLRIGVNDVLRDRPLEEITRDLARTADACIEVSLQLALRTISKKYGKPAGADGNPARLTAFAFGKLGGDELNYSSDIDLMFVYDQEGQTRGPTATIPNADYYSRVVSEVVRLLSSHTDRGFAYRVDLRLRPDGQRGSLARSMAGTLSYYDVRGRTWERQALIKLRPVAGDMPLGREFMQAIEPFIYRKYFSFSEINEVKALKRRMEQRAIETGTEETDVKTGRGGIRDIEYTVQFLQLLNGGDLPAVHQRNTLLSLESLEIAGCLTGHEMYTLSDAYRFLRKTEHRLQLLFDWQTHKLPTSAAELSKLALRMGYVPIERPTPDPEPEEDRSATHPAQRRSPLDESPATSFQTRSLLIEPLDQFLKDYHDKTRLDRAILNHLLHQTFVDGKDDTEPESDLILVQDPDEETILQVVGRYPFREPMKAYQNLAKLAQEEVPYLSHRRCRHFLASIAPQLLRALGTTANPDRTLNNFEQVTASLGGKAILYELFSFNPASLKLYVDICSTSPYLCAILINNPGMIDELLDTLILDQLRTTEELQAELTELLRGASDPDPILHSFQDKELLRVGVRDILGKDSLRDTTAAISDIATTLLNGVFDFVEADLVAKHGQPTTPTGEKCAYAILGLGKLGGREIGYHSDLDLVILYDCDGNTTGTERPTTNFQFYTQLAQRSIRMLSEPGPLGMLYKIDMRLRPTGKSASLVVPLAEFKRYTEAQGPCRLWERQALTRARVVRGDERFAGMVIQAVRAAITAKPWCPAAATEIRKMRERMEPTPPPKYCNVKRSPGGLVDIEFLVQLWQLKASKEHPSILTPNLPEALTALAESKLLPESVAQELLASYLYLRSAELRLRVITDRPTNEIPEHAEDREKLARRMGYKAEDGRTAAEHFQAELQRLMHQTRTTFQATIQAEK